MEKIDNFERFYARLLGSEGGYINNLNDPGGETKYGISKRSYPNIDIKNLTRNEAKAIYKRDFWNRIHADELSDGVAFQIFDFAVNSGIETAIRKSQSAIGVADDGHWGPITREAIKKMSESDIIMRLNAQRLRFMNRLSNWKDASKGWTNRIADNLDYGSEDS